VDGAESRAERLLPLLVNRVVGEFEDNKRVEAGVTRVPSYIVVTVHPADEPTFRAIEEMLATRLVAELSRFLNGQEYQSEELSLTIYADDSQPRGRMKVAVEWDPPRPPLRPQDLEPETPLASDSPMFIVLAGDEVGREIAVAPPMLIGRDAACDVVFHSNMVSRRHLRLVVEEGELIAIDQRSSNGTELNGQPIERAVIKSGDSVLLGSTVKLKLLTPADWRWESSPSSTVIGEDAQVAPPPSDLIPPLAAAEAPGPVTPTPVESSPPPPGPLAAGPESETLAAPELAPEHREQEPPPVAGEKPAAVAPSLGAPGDAPAVVVIDGGSYPVQAALTIGSASLASVRVEGRRISPLHCRVEPAGAGRVIVRDLGSFWGLVHEGRTVPEVALEPGGRVLVGDTPLEVRAPGDR
jgi:hypothetical protein